MVQKETQSLAMQKENVTVGKNTMEALVLTVQVGISKAVDIVKVV